MRTMEAAYAGVSSMVEGYSAVLAAISDEKATPTRITSTIDWLVDRLGEGIVGLTSLASLCSCNGRGGDLLAQRAEEV